METSEIFRRTRRQSSIDKKQTHQKRNVVMDIKNPVDSQYDLISFL